jgi:hypothetical protein
MNINLLTRSIRNGFEDVTTKTQSDKKTMPPINTEIDLMKDPVQIYVSPKSNWRAMPHLAGMMYEKKALTNGSKPRHFYQKPRSRCPSITIDDAKVSNWLDEPDVKYNEEAIMEEYKQPLDESTYRRPGRVFHYKPRGKGGTKGIEMESEALGWKGRSAYSYKEFMDWKKSPIKMKDLAYEDYKLYGRISQAKRSERANPPVKKRRLVLVIKDEPN